MIKTTIVGGALFLLPLVILAFVLGKAFEISMLVAKPFNSIIPIERFAGVALVNILAVILLLIVCYAAGLLASHSAVKDKISTLDGALIGMIPVYAFVKTMVSSIANAEDESGTLRPILINFDEYAQIAFEVERDDNQVVVYLPGAPSPWSGSTTVVDVGRVSPLKIGSHEAAKLVQLLGRGSLKVLPESGREAPVPRPPQ